MSTRKPEINVRQQNIIRELLSAPGKVTLSELADKNGLNSRIIRYNMKVICAWLNISGVEFINKPGYGFEIVASHQKKSSLLEEINALEECDLILTKAQRIRIMLLYLLTSADPISAKTVSEIENFSRSTIFKDLKDIEIWLSNYQIALHKQSAKGLWIEGREESRRFALVRLIREEIGDFRWNRLFDDIENQKTIAGDSAAHCFLNQLKELHLDYTSKLIRFIEENITRKMSQKSRVEIMVYLGVLVHAMRTNRFLHGEPDKPILTTDEFATARSIGYMIETEFSLSPNLKEIELLTALIIGSRWEQSTDRNTDMQLNIPSSDLNEEITQKIINICSMRLHPMLKIDDLLFQELKNHLDYSIFRLKYHIPIRNANLEMIKSKYPDIYRVAESSVFVLENRFNVQIPPEEIGYIAMYLLSGLERLRTEEDSHINTIIANNGVRATSSLLQSRIEYEFPNLRVTRKINSLEKSAINGLEGDLIISTLPIEDSNIPVIHVKPFLEADDIRNIQSWVLEKNQKKRQQNLLSLHKQNSLVDLIKLSNITFADRIDSMQDMVTIAGQPLLDSGVIQNRYLDAMTNLIMAYGFYMYMGSGVLLLHAKPTDGVNHLCMSMLKLKKPFTFDKSGPLKTDIIFVLGATDDNSHLKALFQLNELIQHQEFMASVRDAKKPSDVVNILWQWLPRMPQPAKTQ